MGAPLMAGPLCDRQAPLFPEPRFRATPERIYAVYRGVIYEAMPTIRGLSYHGFPWRGDLKGRRPLPKTILKQLRHMAARRSVETHRGRGHTYIAPLW
jgi:hypothetical protein